MVASLPRFPMFGICPSNRLSPTSRTTKLSMFLIDAGSVPLIRFEAISKFSITVQAPIVSGTVPTRLLSDNIRVSNFDKRANSVGIVPSRPTFRSTRNLKIPSRSQATRFSYHDVNQVHSSVYCIQVSRASFNCRSESRRRVVAIESENIAKVHR